MGLGEKTETRSGNGGFSIFSNARDYYSDTVGSNMYICLRTYLSLFVTNCSGERSFSAQKRIKNYLGSTLKDEKLNHLVLCI